MPSKILLQAAELSLTKSAKVSFCLMLASVPLPLFIVSPYSEPIGVIAFELKPPAVVPIVAPFIVV